MDEAELADACTEDGILGKEILNEYPIFAQLGFIDYFGRFGNANLYYEEVS
jgi:hypothetical protein